MPPVVESKILDYFRTAPLAAARLMLSLSSDEVRRRAEPLAVPVAKTKRGRPRKAAAAPPPSLVNGVEQPGEAVAIDQILSQ